LTTISTPGISSAALMKLGRHTLPTRSLPIAEPDVAIVKIKPNSIAFSSLKLRNPGADLIERLADPHIKSWQLR
jgi:hypothetical protein